MPIQYHQQKSFCGKDRCQKCHNRIGHGPYWYAYETINGRTSRRYIGKNLPPGIQIKQEGNTEAESLIKFRIYTLGQFRIEYFHQGRWELLSKPSWQQQRVRSLLACLITNQFSTREQLMEELWPENELEKASARLDRSIYEVRRLLEPDRHRNDVGNSIIQVEQGVVSLSPDHIWIDREYFEHLLKQAWHIEEKEEREQLLKEAYQLYGGDFLSQEGNSPSLVACRERIHRSWISLLTALADLQTARQATEAALETLHRLIKEDSLNEGAVQRLMRLLWQRGQRDKAILAYKRLTTLLRQEHDIVPLPETRSLFESIQHGMVAVVQQKEKKSLPIELVGRTHHNSLIGRDQERAYIEKLLALIEMNTRFKSASQKRIELNARFPQSACLVGDIGIGKTRLAEEVSIHAREQHWSVFWTRSYQLESHIPYRFWTDLLRQFFERSPTLMKRIKGSALFQPLILLFPDLQEWMPEKYQGLLGEQEQIRLWEAILELLLFMSEQTPLLIVFDDIQWSDDNSCDLLIFLLRRIRGAPIFCLLTCRDHELSELHPLHRGFADLQREQAIELITLTNLTEQESELLLSQVSTLPQTQISRIIDRAKGNPYFVEELARAASQDESLPHTIAAALALRLNQLSPQCLSLLSKASVLREGISFTFLSSLEAELDEETLVETLEEALRAGMLSEEGSGLHVIYRYWHPLLAQYLYEHLSSARRASFHRRVAEIMEQHIQTQQEKEERAATILFHLEHAADTSTEKIAQYAILAGDYAYKMAAYKQTMDHYKLAFSYGTQPHTNLHIWERYSESARIYGDQQTAFKTWEQVLLLHEPQREEEPELHAGLLIGYAQIFYDIGLCIECEKYLNEAEKLLKKIEGGTTWAYFCWQKGCLMWMLGNFEQAQEYAQRSLAYFEQAIGVRSTSPVESTSLRRTLAGDPVDIGRALRLLSALAVANPQKPDPQQGLAYVKRALTIFEQSGRRRETSGVLCDIGNIYMMLADYNRAKTLLERCLSELRLLGDRPMIAVILFNLGVTASAQNRKQDAQTYFEEAIDLVEKIQDLHYVPLFSGDYCLRLLHIGNFEKATFYLRKSLLGSKKVQDSMYAHQGYIALAGWLMYRAEKRIKGSREQLRLLNVAQFLLSRSKGKLDTDSEAEASFLQVRLYWIVGDMDQVRSTLSQIWHHAHNTSLIWIQKRAEQLSKDLEIPNIF